MSRRPRDRSASRYRMAQRLACVILTLVCVPIAAAATAPAAPGGAARLVSVRPLGGRQFEVLAYSAAMDRQIPLWVSHPNAAAPALYLLNAVDGGESRDGWTDRTDAANFFADKNINVIVPLAGRGTYYADWEHDDPALGRNKWATFLARELPPLLNAAFKMTGRNAIAGLSMSATSALDLAIGAPGLYQAVGAYSGCPTTTGPLAQALVYAQLAVFGGNAGNMWGPPSDRAWADHDPILHADRLRGTRLYVSAGSGSPGLYDTLNSPGVNGNVTALIDRLGVGGVMEAIVGQCTRPLVDRLRALGIPATVNLRPAGTHAWTYWQDDLHGSWPMFAAATGA